MSHVDTETVIWLLAIFLALGMGIGAYLAWRERGKP